ncbi:hypothetical protein B0H10DRAFT_1938473 [Mycena sp. CBHHK59/15]|nr:hypothetical protein B0H10DRAFT_1938473 [Mycena sp. CBHHK59/15]
MSRAEAFKARRKGGKLPATTHVNRHTISVSQITGHAENAPITAFVDRVSDDNRRSYRNEVIFNPGSPLKRQHRAERERLEADGVGGSGMPPAARPSAGGDDFSQLDVYQMGFDADDKSDCPHPPANTKTRRFVKPSDPALHNWRPRRDEYIACLLRRAGCLGVNEEVCRVCKARRPPARCKECFGDDLLCSPCLVDRHAENPLHHVEVSVFPIVGVFLLVGDAKLMIWGEHLTQGRVRITPFLH